MNEAETKHSNTKSQDLSLNSGMIGAAVPRPDAIDKVRGEARFVDDLVFSGMLHAAVIWSEFPHAKIRNIDLTAIMDDPRVVCTLTSEEVPGDNIVHVIYDDQPALAAGIDGQAPR